MYLKSQGHGISSMMSLSETPTASSVAILVAHQFTGVVKQSYTLQPYLVSLPERRIHHSRRLSFSFFCQKKQITNSVGIA